ncbi:MAG: DNA-3-methyladenine glycosylase I [Piscirickettsiaceae bacterium]|nr:DNA-3-methyladenine glycosylase I [Piscirickettsiaceae bacterium]
MQKFSVIYQRAIERKGGEEQLIALFPTGIKTAAELSAIPHDRYLAEMTKAIFKAGFIWKIIDHKWAGFEEAFWHFNIARCSMTSPEDLESLYQDTRIIRNSQKIDTVYRNAAMILALSEQYDSFASLIANWPDDDFIGLLDLLHKNGSRLGKKTCQYFLRFIGKDGFVLAQDGIAALINAGVITTIPNSKRDLKLVQHAYNIWRDESGLANAQISRVLSLSIG